jgi:IMP and pyridine-specific 5'-nucleotidase
VAVVTAAGYGLDGSKYARRLRGLLDRFIAEKLTRAEVECFYVFGGECNYLMQCTMRDYLLQRGGVSGIAADDGEPASAVMFQPVPVEEWQSDRLSGPKPMHWPMEEVTQVLDIAEQSMKATVKELNLRAKVLLLLLLLLAVSAASLLY